MNWLSKLFNDKMKYGRELELPFKPGDIVNVEHDLFPDPVISIVQETDDNYIYLAYPYEFRGSGVKVGDKLECRVNSANAEYLISCRINNINMYYPMYLHLYVENISVYESRRASKRYLADYDVYCLFPDTEEKVTVTLKNISQTGVLISTPNKNIKSFENSSEVNMKLVTDDNETVYFSARLIRTTTKGRFNQFGMQIDKIDRTNRAALEKVINNIEDELGSLVLSYIMSGSVTEAGQ